MFLLLLLLPLSRSVINVLRGGCVNIVAQSFSQLRRTKTADVSTILSALGATSATRTDLQAPSSLLLLISTHYFVIVTQTRSLRFSKDTLGF